MTEKLVCKRSLVKNIELASGGVVLGHAGVSKSDDQNNAIQSRAPEAAGCQRLFEAAASGGRWVLPDLHRMLGQLEGRKTAVVWKLDRRPRALKDVLHIMERNAEVGASFRSTPSYIDTMPPVGHATMHIVGSVAEYEPRIMREQTSLEISLGERSKTLHDGKPLEVFVSVLVGRKNGVYMTRLSESSQPTASRTPSEDRGRKRKSLAGPGQLAQSRSSW